MSIEYELPLSFRPTKELKEAIIKQAQIEDRPVSNMIRTLVKRGLAATTKGRDWEGRQE